MEQRTIVQANGDVVMMDDLVEDVCWDLLRGAEIARMGFVIDDTPWIIPVNFGLVGHAIVFRTASASMLHSLAEGARVVVEVDHVDAETRTGWSVLVHGELQPIGEEALALVDGAVHPWAPDDK